MRKLYNSLKLEGMLYGGRDVYGNYKVIEENYGVGVVYYMGFYGYRLWLCDKIILLGILWIYDMEKLSWEKLWLS